MVRIIILVLVIFTSSISSLIGQPVHLPAYPTYPSYPGYYGYNRHVEGKLYTAKDYWAAKKKAFSQGNMKELGSAQEHGSRQVREERDKRYNERLDVAKEVYGTNQQNVSSASAASTASDKEPVSGSQREATVTAPPAQPVAETPPSGVIDSSKLVGDGSFARASIARILTDQLGVPYSSDGETPEDGFSPVGLIKYVALRMGVVPRVSTAAEIWERSGLFLQVRYGQFQTADILFYKLFSKSAQKDELFVALALDDTYMVYPSFSRNKVIKRSYKDDFWKKHFIGAKRIPPQMR